MAETMKFTLIAHHIGTRDYVIASPGGALSLADEGLVGYWRQEERLQSFDDVAKAMYSQADEMERLHLRLKCKNRWLSLSV